MKRINIYEANTRISELINLVLEGKGVVICRNNRPVVQLIPCGSSGKERELG